MHVFRSKTVISDMTRYRAKQTITAAQWRGDNLDEMKELLKDVVESNEWDGPEVYSEYIEPYFLPRAKIDGGGYNMLEFYSSGTCKEEVDPGRWVVVYEDNEVEIMDYEQFDKMFELGV